MNKISIIEYDDKEQVVKVKYLGNIPYEKIYNTKIDTTETEWEDIEQKK